MNSDSFFKARQKTIKDVIRALPIELLFLIIFLEEETGLEPATPALKVRSNFYLRHLLFYFLKRGIIQKTTIRSPTVRRPLKRAGIAPALLEPESK